MTISDDVLQSSGLQTVASLPVALILFGAVALFLILRLRSILGKRVGFEKPPSQPGRVPGFTGAPALDSQAIPISSRPVPDPRSALGERLMAIVNADPTFDPPKFLASAEKSFRIIVAAFAAGDRTTLKTLLSQPVFQTFEHAIASRESEGHRHRTEIKSIISSTIEDAQLIGDQAAVVVKVLSDQVNVTLDKAGTPINGTDSVVEIVDLWTFERALKSKDQTWRLAAARSG